MKYPMTTPKTMPIKSITGNTTHGFQPRLIREAATTVVRARMPLTDRSIPPETMTNVSPTTQMIRNGVVMNRLKNACPSCIALNEKAPARYTTTNRAMVADRGRNFRCCSTRATNALIIAPPPHAGSHYPHHG